MAGRKGALEWNDFNFFDGELIFPGARHKKEAYNTI